MDSKRVEQVIAAASEMKQGLEDLLAAFRELTPIIDDEHAAISASDLTRLETVTDRKVHLAEAISIKVAQMQNWVESLRRLTMDVMPEAAGQTVATFGEAVIWLRRIHESLTPDLFGAQVLGHLVTKLEQLLAEFRSAKTASQPKIEMNTYLVRKLLEHHRQTYRLWQEVARESNATYTSSGATKSKESASVLRVKA